jgi:hypothetical protein
VFSCLFDFKKTVLTLLDRDVYKATPYLFPTSTVSTGLTRILLTTTIVAPPSNASKWQMGFNSAFKGLNAVDLPAKKNLA